MNRKQLISGLIFLFTTVFVFLHVFYSYHFFYIEQFQLFIFARHFFIEHLLYPGGFVEYLSQFVVQFFILPYIGPTIVALLIAILFLVTASIFNKQYASEHLKNRLWLVPGIVALSCLYLSVSFNSYLQGIFAYFICLLSILFFLSMQNLTARFWMSVLAIPLIYWLAGSVSFLFSATLSIVGFHQNTLWKRKLYWAFFPIWAIIISYLSVRLGFSGDFRISFLPDMYNQPRIKADIFVYLPWLLLVGFTLIVPFLKKVEFVGSRITHATQIVIFFAIIVWGLTKVSQRKFYAFQKLDYYARNEQWDLIIEAQSGNEQNNYLLLNYLNLAYAKKGQLLQHLFDANQQGVQCLKIQPDNIRLLAPLLSDINFHIGDFASSQQYAFEGNLIGRGAGSGRMLKRLAEAAIIFENDQLARKYLELLKKTWFYNKWAENKLNELDSTTWSNSPDIVAKRRCLPVKDSGEFASDFPAQLEQLCNLNPENYMALNYLQAYYLLSKDIERLCSFLDSNPKQSLVQRELPEACQQALLAYFETKPDLWAAKGVTIKTVELYQHYKSLLRDNRNDKGLRNLMKTHFGSTYWFYLQFN